LSSVPNPAIRRGWSLFKGLALFLRKTFKMKTSERRAPGRPKHAFLIISIEEKYDLSASEGLFFTLN
jgi:hypothetical protein